VDEVALGLGVLAALGLVPAGYAWLGARARRLGVGPVVLAPLQEIWDPIAHNTSVEVQVLAEREAPAPAPGDPPIPPGRR
jgi:hypothetical protein